MKRYILMCVASLMGVLFAQADNISVQDVTMTAGQSGTISISLTNSATNYVSFQMDLYLPNGFTLNKTGNTLSNRFSSGELVVGRQSDGAYRLTATSLALNPITGTSGVLLTLSVNAPSSPASGTANISNILFADNQSASTTMTDVSFSLFAKGEQSLSFSSIPTKTYGDAAYTLPSQTEQGLTLTWSVNNTSVATVSGNTLTIKGAGTATVTATQAGNSLYLPFTKTYTLTVNKAPLTITAQSYTITYGSSLPTFAATYSGFKNNETSSVLTQQPTFSCSATSSSAPGTYAITVSGAQAQNYAISYVNGTLTVNAKNASNLTISSIAAQTYTGSAITPTVTVKDGTKTLTSGTDYTVAYSNNVNAGTATVTVTGKGNYTGTKTATFTINAKNASDLTIGSIAAQNYTGSAFTPAITVQDGTTTLTEGTDYTVAYSNNVNAGTATVTVTGKGNYTGTKTATFTINAKNASNLTISSIAAQNYTGSAITPAITVQDGTTTLTEGTDYTVAFSNNVNAGTATVTVTGKGNYTGTKEVTFTINAKDASNLTIGSIAAQTYTGSAITPAITVQDGTTTLTEGTDYTVAFSDNVNAGTATVTITGKGNYTGTKTATFTINVKDASNLTIGSIAAQTYTGSAITPAITVQDGTTTLTEGTDYTVAYSDNVNAGTATVTVTGKGNYTGTKTATFTINVKDASDLTISSIAAQTYTGLAFTPAITVQDGTTTLTEGTDYTVAYSNNVNAGTATVTVTGKGNYTGTKEVTFTINAKNASDLTIGSIAAQTYTGSAITPAITVQDGTTTLTEGTDYTVAYSNNVNAGTATVTVTGKGNYTGTKEVTFTINAKDASNLTIGSIAAQTYTGSAITPAITVQDGTTTLTEGTDYTVAFSDNVNAGTATVTVTGKGNYTGTKTATFTINVKDASDLTISSIAAQTYTGSAFTPAITVQDGTTTLTEGTDYTVAYSNNVNAGTATVTVTGKGNYTGTKTATFTIDKAPLTISAQDATMEYGGEVPTFEVTFNGFVNGEDASVLTAQPAISTSATSSSTPGTYAITVSGAEAQNYAISYVNGTLTIGKRTQTIALANELTLTYGDSQFELPEETEQGLELYWSSNNAQVAAVVGTTLVVRGAGAATITAEQEGDARNLPLLKDYTVTVQKAPLTVTAKSYTIEQGQPLPTFAATYEGFVNNQTERVLTAQPTFTCEAANSDVPGTYTITPAGAEAKNYEMTYVSGTLTITPQPASTVTAKSYTIKYGDPLPELEFTAEGFELDGTPELSCEATSASPVGTYEITVSKGSLKNYNVTFVSGTLTIEKAPLTVTAQDAVMTYGYDLPTFEASYEGFRNNDDASVLTALPQLTTEATPQSGVGTYAINADGCEAQNYEMTYVSGTLTIEKAPLTVTPQDAVMTYGDDLPVFEASYEGFRNDDDASVLTAQPLLTTEATPQSGVGDYEIAAAGAEAENYEISYATGTLTIGKAMVTVTAQDYTMKQGDALPEFEATYEGFRNGDDSDVLSQLPTFGCEATSASEPGTYAISVGGAEAANYEFTYVSGTLTIGVADPVTITALNYTIKYGDDMPDFEFTSEGAELTGTPQLICEATSESPVGTYEITVTQGSVENYNVTYVSGTLTIEKAPLTITAQSYTIIQGEEFPVFEALYDGFKNGETESVLKRQPQLATFADEFSEPGDYEIIVAGARADNYEISYVNGTLTIMAPEPSMPTFIARIPNSNVQLKSSNGEVSIGGLADGTKVGIYTAEGMLVGTTTAVDGSASLQTSLAPGTVVIVRMGNKSVKMVVK